MGKQRSRPETRRSRIGHLLSTPAGRIRKNQDISCVRDVGSERVTVGKQNASTRITESGSAIFAVNSTTVVFNDDEDVEDAQHSLFSPTVHPYRGSSCRDKLQEPVAPRRQGSRVPSLQRAGVFGSPPLCVMPTMV